MYSVFNKKLCFVVIIKNSFKLIGTVEQLTINKIKKIKSFPNLIFSLSQSITEISFLRISDMKFTLKLIKLLES